MSNNNLFCQCSSRGVGLSRDVPCWLPDLTSHPKPGYRFSRSRLSSSVTILCTFEKIDFAGVRVCTQTSCHPECRITTPHSSSKRNMLVTRHLSFSRGMGHGVMVDWLVPPARLSYKLKRTTQTPRSILRTYSSTCKCLVDQQDKTIAKCTRGPQARILWPIIHSGDTPKTSGHSEPQRDHFFH